MEDIVFSEDRKYRYVLTRELNGMFSESSKAILFIGLNPSTADEFKNDPTIRRVIGYSKEFGYDYLYVGNLFAYRSTDPKGMLSIEEPIGKDNDYYLQEMINRSSIVLCGWGTIGRHMNRDKNVLDMIGDKAYCLSINKDGTPGHPLYLKKNLGLKKYEIKL